MRYAIISICSILTQTLLAISLLSSTALGATQQTIDKAPPALSIDENPALELQIIEFLTALSSTYKKGETDGYLSFYSASAIENGLNSLEKIKAHYLSDIADNSVTAYEFDIYEIKNLGRYSVIDGAYNKTFINKSTGETYNTGGDVRIKVLREQGFKIEAIDYDRYIRNEYVIGPEDVLEISVWKSPDLSTTTIVRPDGMISLPLIGEIKANNRTARELKGIIEQKLGEYKQDPVVSVIVREANSQSIYVMGEIARPGKYLLRSETRILQAISLAGGFTPGANKDNIIVLRKSLTNPEGKRIRIKYSDIISGKNPEANILVRSGDTILLQPY